MRFNEVFPLNSCCKGKIKSRNNGVILLLDEFSNLMLHRNSDKNRKAKTIKNQPKRIGITPN